MSKYLFWKGCMKDVPDFHHKIWIFLLSEIHPYFVNSMFPILWNWLFFSIKIWLVNWTCHPLDFYNIKESLLSLIKLPLFFSNTCRRSFVWRKKTLPSSFYSYYQNVHLNMKRPVHWKTTDSELIVHFYYFCYLHINSRAHF